MSAPLVTSQPTKNAIQRVKYTHDGMIDLMLANPAIRQNDIAAHFGMTVGWVSRVINSDAFQARLAARKEDTIDPQLRANFEDRLKGLAATSLQIVQNKLDNIIQLPVPSSADAEFAKQTLELTAKALGFGARVQGPTNIQNQFVVALPSKIESEKQWAEVNRSQIIEAPVREV